MSEACRGASATKSQLVSAVMMRQQTQVITASTNQPSQRAIRSFGVMWRQSLNAPSAPRDTGISAEPSPHYARGVLAQHDNSYDDEKDAGGTLELVTIEGRVERSTDAACPDNTDYG